MQNDNSNEIPFLPKRLEKTAKSNLLAVVWRNRGSYTVGGDVKWSKIRQFPIQLTNVLTLECSHSTSTVSREKNPLLGCSGPHCLKLQKTANHLMAPP